MKKLLLCAVLLAGLLCGCSKDEPTVGELLLGRWTWSDDQAGFAGGRYWEFRADGSGFRYDSNNGDPKIVLFVYSLDGSILTLMNPATGDVVGLYSAHVFEKDNLALQGVGNDSNWFHRAAYKGPLPGMSDR